MMNDEGPLACGCLVFSQKSQLNRAMLNVMLEMLSMLDRYPNSFKGSKASCLTPYLNLNQAGNEDGH
jgi:hypothetical protein